MKNILFLAMLSLFLHAGANAQTSKIPFNLTNGGSIKLALKNSNVKITGYSKSGIEITAFEDGSTTPAKEKTDLAITNNNNVLSITKQTEAKYSYVINVPSKANLSFEEEFRPAKEISISGIEGKVEVKSWVSKIVLKNVSGPVTAASQSADITVEYSTLKAGSTNSIISGGRVVDITLPANAKADLKLDVMSGKVISDFGLGVDAQKLLTDVGKMRQFTSKLNSGGAAVYIKAKDITIHKAK